MPSKTKSSTAFDLFWCQILPSSKCYACVVVPCWIWLNTKIITLQRIWLSEFTHNPFWNREAKLASKWRQKQEQWNHEMKRKNSTI
jgi:hypothetical protein